MPDCALRAQFASLKIRSVDLLGINGIDVLWEEKQGKEIPFCGIREGSLPVPIGGLWFALTTDFASGLRIELSFGLEREGWRRYALEVLRVR